LAIDTTNVAMPPSYDIATKLPTYEEAEILKIEQDQIDQQQVGGRTLDPWSI